MRFDNYKFRSSGVGKIVSKSGKLTETTKSYIQELFIQSIYGVKKEISSKYLEKGLFEEESGITLLNKALYSNSILIKNKERKENDFISGECDCTKDGIVYDIKNAWDLFTFGKADLTHDYKWQLISYMWLWNLDKARLFYCLNNTPEHLLVDEERKLFYKNNFISFEDKKYLDLCTELRAKHNYDNMPLNERFKIWELEKVEEDIENLKASIISARKYMNELFKQHEERIDKNNLYIKGLI